MTSVRRNRPPAEGRWWTVTVHLDLLGGSSCQCALGKRTEVDHWGVVGDRWLLCLSERRRVKRGMLLIANTQLNRMKGKISSNERRRLLMFHVRGELIHQRSMCAHPLIDEQTLSSEEWMRTIDRKENETPTIGCFRLVLEHLALRLRHRFRATSLSKAPGARKLYADE